MNIDWIHPGAAGVCEDVASAVNRRQREEIGERIEGRGRKEEEKTEGGRERERERERGGGRRQVCSNRFKECGIANQM
jgi:hypothetical protein